MRIDYGTASSIITNPASAKMIILDHVKQEVRIIPIPPSITPPQLTPPGIPGMPGAPVPPPTSMGAVKDLGIKVIQGVEARGTQVVMPALAAVKPPIPPAVPGMPGAPAVPGMPAAPALPMIAESWVSTKLQMPVLTRITGSFGQSMCHCKNTVPGEPSPTAFQIPPNYKQVGLPPAPTAPAPPSMPSAPAAPAMPSMPSAPKPPTFKF